MLLKKFLYNDVIQTPSSEQISQLYVVLLSLILIPRESIGPMKLDIIQTVGVATVGSILIRECIRASSIIMWFYIRIRNKIKVKQFDFTFQNMRELHDIGLI